MLSWNPSGVLPPIAPNEHPAGLNRSPYLMTLAETADFFVTTEARLKIFRGFVLYRRALYDAGFCKGFQWLNGSFVEQIEMTRKKPPKDTDVVTFVHLPQDCHSQKDLLGKYPDLFTPAKAKTLFQVDGYTVILGGPMTPEAVRQVTYWYSLWSHQRETHVWKGFVQISLNPAEDKAAEEILKMREEALYHESR